MGHHDDPVRLYLVCTMNEWECEAATGADMHLHVGCVSACIMGSDVAWEYSKQGPSEGERMDLTRR